MSYEDGVTEPVEGVEPVDGTEPNEGSKPNPLEPGGVRFEQIYGKMKDFEAQAKQYKELGDIAELRRIREEHSQWKKAVDEYKSKQNMSPEEQNESARVAAIRKELLKVYPELERVNTVSELMKQVEELKNGFSEQSTRSTLAKASESFSKVLKENKVDLKYQDKLEEYVVAQMDDAQRASFLGGDFSVAEKIFTNELKEGLFAGLRAKSPLPTPGVRNTAGGTPPAGKKAGPSTLKEAEDAAWARIANRE